MSTPLENPEYVPQHPPVDGVVPDVVEKWGPASQLRWFDRFRADLKPQKPTVWARFYCSTTQHRGECCVSCEQDRDYGFGDDLEGMCCCRALKDDGTPA